MQQPLIHSESNMETATQTDDVADRTSLASVSSSQEVDIVMDLDSVEGSGASGSDPENNQTPPEPLVQDETRAIVRSKLLMGMVLTLAAALGAYFTYRYILQQEIKEFDRRFDDVASQIFSVYQINSHTIFDVYDSFSFQFTSHAIGTNSPWPCVTLPAFEAQADKAMNQTGGRSMGVAYVVEIEDRTKFENYTKHNTGWRQDALDYRGSNETASSTVPFIWNDFRNFGPAFAPLDNRTHFMPMWQVAPLVGNDRITMFDTFGFTFFPSVWNRVVELRLPVLSEIRNLDDKDEDDNPAEPESFIVAPIFEDIHGKGKLVAGVISLLPWRNYFENLLPEDTKPVYMVIRNTCDQEITFLIDGPEVEYLGPKDLHDFQWNSSEKRNDFLPFSTKQSCQHTLFLYPTDEFHSFYVSKSKPYYYTAAVLMIFFLTAMVFVLYDCLVEKRQDKVLTKATQSNAIVSSLFPATVRDRLLNDATDDGRKRQEPKAVMKPDFRSAFAIDDLDKIADQEQQAPTADPIADLFPNASVLFADISGFTAWSSTREPTQVFTLLEGIYNAFDRIARRRKVFKVETIGDCYVAATGLPEERDDHAVAMCRFARDCLTKMSSVLRKLEVQLGPDTCDLGMRMGIHSGPVTAGVLRGEKSRFQLFGDTVNTASRMESTGMRNKIQISKDTADLVIASDCQDLWVEQRLEMIEAKGKGKLQTFWLLYLSHAAKSVTSSTGIHSMTLSTASSNGADSEDEDAGDPDSAWPADNRDGKMQRLVNWNVDMLQKLLKRVVAMRNTNWKKTTKPLVFESKPGQIVLDEVIEIISLPNRPASYKADPKSVILPPEAVEQLYDYVSEVAGSYQKNPFHSFAHASHVTQSVIKLLSRIVTVDSIEHNTKRSDDEMHNYTYGITSDPLTQFAVVFSALIHDVDHPGVPNAQLVKEQTDDANFYRNKSVAEQNSVDAAWNLLMEPCYKDLRACIYTTKLEMERFRQLVVNSVMATDIVDKELGALRKGRWEKAFAENQDANLSQTDDLNRKATIVIEHLIQASDVAHTMQHWHVYLKWNERLFFEMFRAYKIGRGGADPSESWYEGELGFFDFYIIPLAKKLKECGVFGVSSDEYLNYALENREEWKTKGKGIVERYVEQAKKRYGVLDALKGESSSPI